MTVQTYLAKKATLQGTYKRANGKGYYLINNEWVDAKPIEEANRLPITLFNGKENPDGTRKYLY